MLAQAERVESDLDAWELVWAFHRWGDGRILQGVPPVQFLTAPHG